MELHLSGAEPRLDRRALSCTKTAPTLQMRLNAVPISTLRLGRARLEPQDATVPISRLRSERSMANFNVKVSFQERGKLGSRCERVISSRCRARPTDTRYVVASTIIENIFMKVMRQVDKYNVGPAA